MRRRVEEVKTPLRVIFKELCKAGWVNGNIAGDGMCELHSDTNHTIEDCEEFKRMLQDMMDRKLVQIGCGGNIVDVSVIDYSASTSPKPLVVHYTRDAAVRTTNRPIPITIQVPTSFPYKDNKAVPWRYDVEVLVGDRQIHAGERVSVRTRARKVRAGGEPAARFYGKARQFGLGYKPSNADVKRLVEEKEEKEVGQARGSEPRTGGVPICDIRESL
ncbi:hypothetical protein SESBI_07463 [Sesbania bispinosa]|nr:hypothetical protein SESBI_07463 [Sesbania bispinosa]